MFRCRYPVFTMRFSQAQAAIPTRLRTPSFVWIPDTWLLTVLSEMNSSAAISWLVRPLAMARTTSISRSDSGRAGPRDSWCSVGFGQVA